MRFHKDIYLGRSVKKLPLIKFRLKNGIGQIGLRVIALNRGRDMLDIYNIEMFKLRWMRRQDMTIVAIVRDDEELEEYLVSLIGLTYRKRGDYLIKEYYS